LGGSVDEYIAVGGNKERQYMYSNVTLRSVRATIVVVEEQ
jgi:hypothetical protein